MVTDDVSGSGKLREPAKWVNTSFGRRVSANRQRIYWSS